MLFICSASFCTVPTTKDSLLRHPPTTPPSLPPSAPLSSSRKERECGFNQRGGQPPPLMIHSRGTFGLRSRGETECSMISAMAAAHAKPRQYDSSADCPRRQIHPAARHKDRPPWHILYRGRLKRERWVGKNKQARDRERLKKKQKVSESVSE